MMSHFQIRANNISPQIQITILHANIITTIGFILSCALCFVLAARGLRLAAGQGGGARSWVTDTVTGLLIAAPVYWMFTKFLAINLPGLTQTGWL